MLKKKRMKDSYPVLPDMNNKEEVMAYCREIYPKGTKYFSVNTTKVGKTHGDTAFTVSFPENFEYMRLGLIWAEPRKGQLYYEGVWAKVIKNDD